MYRCRKASRDLDWSSRARAVAAASRGTGMLISERKKSFNERVCDCEEEGKLKKIVDE